MTIAATPTDNVPSRQSGDSAATIVFVALALIQAEFYGRVAEIMQRRGVKTAVILLHEPSLAWLRRSGIETLNFYDVYPEPSRLSDADISKRLRHYDVGNLLRLVSHEKRFFDLRDTRALAAKLAASLDAMQAAIGQLRARFGDNLVIVQELGGFLSVIAAALVARRQGVPNIFIEPSFFRGRLFFTRDSFGAPRVPALRASAPSQAVREYLATTAADQQIVIPHKDVRHYQRPWRKVFSWHSVRRLLEKTVQKHVRGEREEFRFIGSHVRRHVRMIVQEWGLRDAYRDLPPATPYVYYPLHVPGDFALTIRSPEYLDQFALIDYVARNLPYGYVLAVKEHPAMVGAFSATRMRELLRLHDNVVLVSPARNNFAVIRDAAAVVTVNSKSGAEALMLRRPVLVLGDAFYGDSPLVHRVEALADLPGMIGSALASPMPSEDDVLQFFECVWRATYPGELYNSDLGNCATFADSVETYLAHAGAPLTSG